MARQVKEMYLFQGFLSLHGSHEKSTLLVARQLFIFFSLFLQKSCFATKGVDTLFLPVFLKKLPRNEEGSYSIPFLLCYVVNK